MKVLSDAIYDYKIESYNIITEMSLREYYEFVKDSMLDNVFQRSKVKSSKTTYSLLKQDLITGCIIPPIVLSMSLNLEQNDRTELSKIANIIQANKNKILILDGLQRTYTIKDIVADVEKNLIEPTILDNLVRVEIYLGLNKEGILYRMLTLNTGQTPMNLRHQIEIVYSDLIDAQNELNFKLVKGTEKDNLNEIGVYKFSDSVDLFTSFLENDYLQITREKLLSTIKSFDNLSKLRNKTDIFGDLMTIYTLFVQKVDDAIGNSDIKTDLNEKMPDNLFGKDAVTIFHKSQPLTGFGAALSRLLDLEAYTDIKSISDIICKIDNDDLYEGLLSLLIELDDIRKNASKIGNAQRCFFYHFFRIYFDAKGDCFLSSTSIKRAKQAYDRDN